MRKSTALLLVLFLAASCLMVIKPIYSSVVAAENTWTQKAPLQQARAGLGVAAVNGKIYAIGGSTEGGQWGGVGQISMGPFVSTNEEYDPTTDTWTFKTPMLTPRGSFGIAVYQSKIYCIGGITSEGNTGVNEVYDPSTDTWETASSMPAVRHGLQANVVDGKIYLIGGVPDSRVNEVYDPSTNSWTTMTPILNYERSHASAGADNKIYVIGGCHDTFQYRGNQIYDSKTDSWSFGAPAPEGVYFGAAGVTTGVMSPKRIYVFGVTFPIGLSAPPFVTQAYNLENNSWTICASIPTARINLGVAVVNDMFYAVGGDTYMGLGQFSPSAVNEQYTPFGYGTIPPIVDVVSPEKQTYNASSVDLVFTVNKSINWTGYTLDNQENVTISGNTTISGLSNGLHNVTVYAKDMFENVGASETIIFTIEEPFPTALIAVASGMSIATVGVGLLVYFKKRKR